MKPSIETIWRQGFTPESNLKAPTIAHLYNQQSQNLIDKFDAMFDANHKAVIIGAVTLLLIFVFFNLLFLGLFLSSVLLVLVAIGKQQKRGLQNIDKTMSSLEYLTAFDTWLDQCIQRYTLVYRVAYPVMFSACAVSFIHSDTGQSIAQQFPQGMVVAGTPIPILAFIILVIVMLAASAGAIYQADINMVYGKEINKLKQLIADNGGAFSD